MSRTRKIAVALAACGLIAWAHVQPSGKEQVEDYTECFARYHGIENVSVEYSDYERWTPCLKGFSGLGPDGQCAAGGWALPLSTTVTYYEPYIDDNCVNCAKRTERKHLRWIAAHETCHLSGIWDEATTNECTSRALKEAGCR